MRTLFIVLGIWLLINVLFVVVMIPPRKPRASDRGAGSLRPAPVRTDDGPPEDDPPVSLRHVIIAIALGAFFSLTPPLLEAYDALRRWVRRMKVRTVEREGSDTIESIRKRLRSGYEGPAVSPSENDENPRS